MDAMRRRIPEDVIGVAARFRKVRQGSIRSCSNEMSVTCNRDFDDEKETCVRRERVGVDRIEEN